MMVTEVLMENTHSWVEQAPTYPEEHPCIDSKTEAEAQTDVKHFVDGRVLSRSSCCGGVVCYLCSSVGKEQEQESASEFAAPSNEVISYNSWYRLWDWDSIGLCTLHTRSGWSRAGLGRDRLQEVISW